MHSTIFIVLAHGNCTHCLHANSFVHSLSKGVRAWLSVISKPLFILRPCEHRVLQRIVNSCCICQAL